MAEDDVGRARRGVEAAVRAARKSPGGSRAGKVEPGERDSPPFQRWEADGYWDKSRQGRQNPVWFSDVCFGASTVRRIDELEHRRRRRAATEVGHEMNPNVRKAQ